MTLYSIRGNPVYRVTADGQQAGAGGRGAAQRTGQQAGAGAEELTGQRPATIPAFAPLPHTTQAKSLEK